MKYCLIIISILFSSMLLAQQADMIIHNATIYDPGNDGESYSALAIKDGLILDHGSLQQLSVYQGPKTELLDAKGNFLMPGLIEGHGHFYSTGLANLNLDLMETKNWQEIIEMVKEEVKAAKPGEWINGRGWHQEKWNQVPKKLLNGFPFHHELSRISPDNPVVLRHASGHLLMANQKAMELAGINKETPSPSGGEIFKDKDSNPTGIFNETAMDLIRKARVKSQEKYSNEQKMSGWKKAVEKAEDLCLSQGITSFQDAGSDLVSIRGYQDMAAKGELDIRLWIMINDEIESIEENIDHFMQTPDKNFLEIGGIKAYIDGALGSRGAWLLEPYSDMPESHGHRIISEEDFDKLAHICINKNLQLCTHAIGDKGNRVVFETYEKWLDVQDRRWRIEHAQHLNPAEIGRFAEMGVIAAMQPIHCTSDAPFVEKRLGKHRAEEGAYVWRKLLNAKARMNLGTDTPVEKIDPFANIYAACTRQIIVNDQFFYPNQVLTREEALYFYTMGNAYATFQENFKGSLTKGKYADVIILDKNLISCSTEEILSTKVLYTIIGGRVLYSSSN